MTGSRIQVGKASIFRVQEVRLTTGRFWLVHSMISQRQIESVAGGSDLWIPDDKLLRDLRLSDGSPRGWY